MSLSRCCPLVGIDLNINHTELEFIQRGIEELVGQIHSVVSQNAYHQIEYQKQNLRKVTGLDLIEISDNTCNVFKVGSFYEGTKLFYPDEFDFILVFGTFVLPSDEIVSYSFGSGSLFIYGDFERILAHRHFVFSKRGAGLTLAFHKIVANNGCAIKLKFAYYKHRIKEKDIYVDVVPAYQIIDHHLEYKVDKLCSLPEFRKYITDTGRFFITRNSISFTESEVRYMKFHLSPKHVQVYKLLKYLINGNNYGEKLKELCGPLQINFINISSYKIKTCVMFHQSACANDNKSVISCICDVICDVYRSWVSRRWRHLVTGLDEFSEYRGDHRNYNRCRRYRIKGRQLLVNILKELTSAKKNGIYEKLTSIEPWAVTMFREIEVKCVMEYILDDVELKCR